MGTLYMIRHGQASFGSANYDLLSETGVLQSRILAEHLLAVGLAPDALYSGAMERQKDTAGAMVALYREKELPLPALRIEDAFNEYSSREIILSYVSETADEDPSLKEDLSRFYADKKAFQRVFEKILMGWVKGEYRKPGIATWEDFRERVRGGLTRVIAENGRGRTIVIFTSGGPVSATLQTALGLSNEETLRTAWQIANSSVTKFLYNGERITLAAFNDTAHLALRRDPALVTYR
ncbi:MAG: histidine phosphatase family protein [Deltaproteobacteria bacterium]|nr:histidine phosphatase family protein [Deltaproteobacteria bacterium]